MGVGTTGGGLVGLIFASIWLGMEVITIAPEYASYLHHISAWAWSFWHILVSIAFYVGTCNEFLLLQFPLKKLLISMDIILSSLLISCETCS